MKLRNIALIVFMLSVIPLSAQRLDNWIKTNNQQLIDRALDGAFVKINQSYNLCDTVNDKHYGRNDKDYFSIIPFIGIETERGLLFPTATLMPWNADKDFNEYEGQYKPIVYESKLSLLNSTNKSEKILDSIISGDKVTERLSLFNDSIQSAKGLLVDTISGEKDGWLIWLTTDEDIVENDSLKIISIKKEIEVPADGKFITIETPEVSGTIYGGIYVTPTQTGVGQLTFTLTGVMVLDEEEWKIDFPFITAPKQEVKLTPIELIREKEGLNQLKNRK